MLNKILYIITSCFLIMMSSCTKMDEYYKDYIIERSFVGKGDSAWIETGLSKVRISMLTPRDAEAKEILVKWGNSDSLLYPIDPNLTTQSVVINNLVQGSYVFNVYTSNKMGKKSVPVELSTEVYGDQYRSSQIHRYLSHTVVFKDSVGFVWNNVNSETLVGAEVEFTDKNGIIKKSFFSTASLIGVIKDVDILKPIRVRSAFKPSANIYEYLNTDFVDVDLVATKRNKYTFISSTYTDAEFIDFNWVRVYLESEVNSNRIDKDIDLCYTLGSGSRSNLLSINGTGFGVFATQWQTNIDFWSKRNVGRMKLVRSAASLAEYTNLDENDRNQMVNAYNNAVRTPVSTSNAEARVHTIIAVNDIIYFYSETRKIYVAMKVLSIPPGTAGVYGPFSVEFKISRP